jgi:hypothetical protein
MKIELIEKYPIGLIIGFSIGFLVIHPFSMVFQGLFIPEISISYKSFVYSFHLKHLPMALFFGLLGMSIGAINVYYLQNITKSRKRIKLLEGLLPICSYCHNIRDDIGRENGEGHWENIEDYIYKKTDQEFTHGICPKCAEVHFPGYDKNS